MRSRRSDLTVWHHRERLSDVQMLRKRANVGVMPVSRMVLVFLSWNFLETANDVNYNSSTDPVRSNHIMFPLSLLDTRRLLVLVHQLVILAMERYYNRFWIARSVRFTSQEALVCMYWCLVLPLADSYIPTFSCWLCLGQRFSKLICQLRDPPHERTLQR